MSWKRSRRRNDWDDDFFGFDFRTGFEDLDEMIESMFKTALSGGEGPVYYGYSVTVGPDGKPHVKEFGNVKPTRKGTFEMGAREPFVDTVVEEKEGRLKVVAEMPGVEKQDIKLEAHENSLSISARHGDRTYQTNVPLSQKVEPSSASAIYNNGVLEVKLKLKDGQKPGGVNIRVD
jgi:HSP20 family protein